MTNCQPTDSWEGPADAIRQSHYRRLFATCPASAGVNEGILNWIAGTVVRLNNLKPETFERFFYEFLVEFVYGDGGPIMDLAAPPPEPPPEIYRPPEVIEPVGAVEISPGTGSYSSPIAVSLSCPTEGANIRYTLDGTVPDETSPLYDPGKGLLLHESAILKARAFKVGAVSEEAYKVWPPKLLIPPLPEIQILP